jgi:predicted dehydrogenase
MLRVVQVGTGGFGATWCGRFLPRAINDSLIEVVALVDTDPLALQTAANRLEVDQARCFADVGRALGNIETDAVFVVVPAKNHAQIVEAAVARNLDVLSEKPVADSLSESLRLARLVERAGIRMAVTMSHRFDRAKASLRAVVHSGAYGPVDYVSCRFVSDLRDRGSWGNAPSRYDLEHPLLEEASIHHFDLLCDLAQTSPTTVYADSWTPPWGDFHGPSQASVHVHFENDVRGIYEGAMCNAAGISGWNNETIRVECRDATLLLEGSTLRVCRHEASRNWADRNAQNEFEEMPLLEGSKWTHDLIIDQFVRWVEGGAKADTALESVLGATALTFAAVASSEQERVVDIRALVDGAR